MKQYQQVCVSGFILNKNNEVLLVKRSDKDDFLPGLWELPGGGTDFGEYPAKALEREIQEEVGLDVAIGKPLHVDDYFMEALRQAQGKNKIHRVEIFFACSLIDEDWVVKLSHEHSAYKWLSQESLKSFEMTKYMAKALRECFKNI